MSSSHAIAHANKKMTAVLEPRSERRLKFELLSDLDLEQVAGGDDFGGGDFGGGDFGGSYAPAGDFGGGVDAGHVDMGHVDIGSVEAVHADVPSADVAHAPAEPSVTETAPEVPVYDAVPNEGLAPISDHAAPAEPMIQKFDDGSQYVTNADGTGYAIPAPAEPTIQKFDDGSQYVTNADGTGYAIAAPPEPTIQKFDDGSQYVTNHDGTGYAIAAPPEPTIQKFDDGSQYVTNHDGTGYAIPAPAEQSHAALPETAPKEDGWGKWIVDKTSTAVLAARDLAIETATHGVPSSATLTVAKGILQSTGALLGAGFDVALNGKTQSWAEVGALVTKNAIQLGMGAAGPWGIGAAVLADKPVGAFADWAWGTNRYSK